MRIYAIMIAKENIIFHDIFGKETVTMMTM